MEKVQYFGKAFVNISPVLFMFALLYEALRTWNVCALLFACGLILSEAVNFGLKCTFKKPRPDIYAQCSVMTECDWNHRNGMPSSHAQFFGFFLTFLIASIVVQKQYNASVCYLLTVCCLFAIVALVTRVTSGCHTAQQVLAGLIIGVALGFLMFVCVYVGKPSLLYPSGPYVVAPNYGAAATC